MVLLHFLSFRWILFGLLLRAKVGELDSCEGEEKNHKICSAGRDKKKKQKRRKG